MGLGGLVMILCLGAYQVSIGAMDFSNLMIVVYANYIGIGFRILISRLSELKDKLGVLQNTLEIVQGTEFLDFKERHSSVIFKRKQEWSIITYLHKILDAQNYSQLLKDLKAEDFADLEAEFKTLLEHPAPSIELNKVSFSYEKEGEVIINNYSRAFEPGKTYEIMGKSGEGKSTLFNLIAGLLIPTDGEVSINGVKVCPTSYLKHMLHSSYITQNKQIFMASVAENILLGNYDLCVAIERKIKADHANKERYIRYLAKELLIALELSNSLEFIQVLPQQIFTTLGDSVNSGVN